MKTPRTTAISCCCLLAVSLDQGSHLSRFGSNVCRLSTFITYPLIGSWHKGRFYHPKFLCLNNSGYILHKRGPRFVLFYELWHSFLQFHYVDLSLGWKRLQTWLNCLGSYLKKISILRYHHAVFTCLCFPSSTFEPTGRFLRNLVYGYVINIPTGTCILKISGSILEQCTEYQVWSLDGTLQSFRLCSHMLPQIIHNLFFLFSSLFIVQRSSYAS